jgi:hypothetical protein
MLDTVTADTHLREERFQLRALDTEINELCKRYAAKVAASVNELVLNISGRIKDPKVWGDTAETDLITRNEEGQVRIDI